MSENSAFEGVREWEASAFDPQALRHFSLLPEEDADEAYCVRHESRMQKFIPVINHNGALYTTSERFACYTCGNCLADIFWKAMQGQFGIEPPSDACPEDILRSHVGDMFDRWDNGKSPGEWFQFSRGGPGDEYFDNTRFVWLTRTRADALDMIDGVGDGEHD